MKNNITGPKSVGWRHLCLAFLTTCSFQAQAKVHHALIGELLWSDEFNSFQENVWTHEVGTGCEQNICNWGNNERQYYAAENTSIERTPNDPDPENNSLVIEAREEFRDGREYTSARIISKNKVSVHYGMVEFRMMVPDLNHGLWPAAWMLGDSAPTWPQQGEIDIMEMGHSEHEREFNFCADQNTNHFVGANVFHYAEAACHPQNPTCAANYAWRASVEEHSNVSPYCSTESLANKFVNYRLYWTPEEFEVTIIDEYGEHPLYAKPFEIADDNPEVQTFRQPFYLLLNMAVGGNVPDLSIYDTEKNVSAPLPGKLYIDYVRVYQYDGHGEIILGDGTEPTPEPLQGSIGVFTDRTYFDNTIAPGNGAQLYVWEETFQAGTENPYEGENVISWQTDPSKGWFGAGIESGQVQNLSEYIGGTLNFSVKAPADLGFRVGIISLAGENWIDFPANENKYGLERDGDWGQVSIPIHELRGFSSFGDKVDLTRVTNLFAILSLDGAFPSAATSIAIDDIYWSPTGGVDATDSDGDRVLDIEDLCAGTSVGVRVDDDGCAILPETGIFGVFTDLSATGNFLDGSNSDIWSWENSLLAGPDVLPAEGDNVISWTGNGNHWFGVGVEAHRPIDLSQHLEGALKFKIRVPSDVPFQVGIIDLHGAENWLDFPANQNVYGLDRTFAENNWAQVSIPVHYLAGPSASAYSIDMTSLSYVFTIRNPGPDLPPSTFNLAIDDIVWDDEGGVSINDEDNDGVIDIDDQCPGTIEAARVSNQGCAVIAHLGTFGVATETTAVNAELNNENSDTWIWENSFDICPAEIVEGSEAICWRGKANHWFGAGIEARSPLDLSNFDQGNLRFQIKVPGDVEFRVGISDTYGNQSYIRFPANEAQYNLERNGEWEEAIIPMADLRGRLVAIQSLAYAFTILSVDSALSSNGFDMHIDDIYYEGGVLSDNDGDGVNNTNDACPNTQIGEQVNGVGCAASDFDDDGDGVNNVLDLCPGTEEGTAVGEDGCPLSAAEDVKIEAEEFSTYFDSSAGNAGNAYRTDVDVDIEVSADVGGGYNVGWIASGEWLQYPVTLNPGRYEVITRVASLMNTGAYRLTLDGEEIGNFTVPATGAWQVWQSQSLGEIDIQGGDYILRLEATGDDFNLNWIHFDAEDNTPDPGGQLLNATAIASTELQAASFAVDGDMETRWESHHGVDPSSITLDLGEASEIEELRLYWEAANAAIYSVEASLNGEDWTVLSSQSGGVFGERMDRIAVDGQYRYVRIVGTERSEGNHWGYSLWEVEVYGSQ